MLEIPGAKSSGDSITAGKAEVAMCVGCVQMLEDWSGGGGGLVFDIAYELRDWLAVVVRSSRV